MAKKNLILLSLEDSKINKIANVVSNESSKKILDFLAGKEFATESEIAEKISIAISTVHYNLQQLIEAGLVTADEYHYSQKGKEVNRYKLANKYIIIAPKGTKKTSLKQKLKNILPVAIIAAGTAGIIELVNRLNKKAMPLATDLAYGAGERSFKAMRIAEDEAMEMAATKTAQEAATQALPAADITPAAAEAANFAATQTTPLWQNIAFWFFIGAVFTIILFLILSYYKKKD